LLSVLRLFLARRLNDFSVRSRMLQTLVRLGQTGRAEQAPAELGDDERASAEMRTAEAA
jgi:hypothetical protein